MNEFTSLAKLGTQAFRLTADDFIQVVCMGVFSEVNIELVDGELIEFPPFPENFKDGISNAAAERPYRVTTDDYLRMVEASVFGDAHVELVDGVLVEMAPSNIKHGRLLMRVGHLLEVAYTDTGFEIFGHTITLFDERNTRAPDIAVVDSVVGERNQLLPRDILLAVEISGTTLGTDLGRKRIDYASAGIRHYWVVDVEGRRIHTYADPQGADYAAIRVFAFGEAMPVPGVKGAITIT